VVTAVIDLVSATLLGAVGVWALWHRSVPGAVALAIVTLVAAMLPAAAAAVELSSVGPWIVSTYAFVWRTVPPFWLAFATAYTGRGPQFGLRTAAAGAVVATAWQLPGVLFIVRGLWAPFLSLGWLLLIVIVLYAELLLARAATAGELPPRQAAGLLIGGAAITVSLVVVLPTDASGSFPASVQTAVGVVTTASFCVAVADGALRRAPGADRLARERLLEAMTEAAVVTDREGRLADANAAARRLFELESSTFGCPVESVFDTALPDTTDSGRETVTTETTDGRRTFAVSADPVTDEQGEPVGRIYLLRDVTERLTDEQRLDVLGRVLRHNLRNDLDATRAFAERLDAAPDDEDARRRLHDLATGLAETGETVAEMERLFAGRPTWESVDPSAVAERVAAACEPDDTTQVTVTVRTAGRVETDPELLRTVLTELVDNGVTHTTAEEPTVEVVVDADGQTEIAVRDGDPPIPAREREILVDGEEPLRHGSGLGLWFVALAVRRLGGDLAFSQRPAGGNVVTITLPDRDSPET
jgi:signal transduction histidine kinase